MDDSLMESRSSSEIPAESENELLEAVRMLSNGFSGISKFFGLQEYLKKIPEEAVKIDAAMAQLGRTCGASASELDAFFKEAADSAQKYGCSLDGLIDAATQWSRLGYGLPDAKVLAEAATLYSHITGMDLGASNEALVSTVQGLQLEAAEVKQLLDMLAKTGNGLSIDPAGIGRALQESAAAFRAAGTELPQAVALAAGTENVMSGSEAAADLWNAVETHIYGARQELAAAGTETDGMLESAAQLRDLVQGLTGFDIMADSAGTQLKDLYSIIVGIGQQWQNLSAPDQAVLLDALAGSQGDALSSVLNNVTMIEKAYLAADHSSGAALQAQEKYEQGIQHSLDRLASSFQEFAGHLADSGLLKGVVDFGSGTVNVLNAVTEKFGLLGSAELAGAGFGITKFIKNLDCRKVLKIA